MAEPISLIASVAGLLDVSLRSSKALHSLQSQLRNAPNLIRALSNEVEDLKAVLARIEDTKNASKVNGQHVPTVAATMVDLEKQLRKAKVTLADLDTLTKKLAAEKPTLKRIKWCLKESRASELRTDLKEMRTKINELLVAHNRQVVRARAAVYPTTNLQCSCISNRIHLEVCDVRLETQRHQSTVIQRLDASSQATSNQLISTQQTINQNHAYIVAALQTLQAKTPDLPPGWHQAVIDQLSAIREETKANRMPAVMKENTTQSPFLAQKSPAETKAYPYGGQSEPKFPPGLMNSSFFITLGMMKSGCQSNCPCRCHFPRSRHSWTLPRVLDAVIGSLFIGYTSNPVASPKCNLKGCSKARSIRLRLVYSFPLWFLNYTVHMLVEASTARPFTLGLVSYRRTGYRVSDQNILFQARSGNLTGVRRILQTNRAALLDVGRDGRTILLAALRGKCPWEKRLETIQLLLQAGADPDQEDDYGSSMRLEVVRHIMRYPGRHSQLQELFPMSQSADMLELTFLHKIIVGQCHVDLATTLQSRSPDILAQIDVPDIVGETPLIYAARLGHVDQVKALIDAGADVKIKRKNGGSALNSAANTEIVDLLIRAGADVHATNGNDGTALDTAARNNNTEIVEKLLSMGARVNGQTSRGALTPLHMAAQYNSADATRLLSSRGGDIEAKDGGGRSPLNVAIRFNSHDTIAALLELGADYLSQDHGTFFLYHAARYGDEKTLRILASFELEGVNTNAVNRKGWTAYEVFERRSEIPESLRSAFHSLLEVLSRNQSSENISEGQSGSDDEAFVDAAEFLEPDSYI
jgi:ankyrin repeat protein